MFRLMLMWCSIETIYDDVWNAIVNSDGFELVKHGESDYLCRYVHSSEVGITDIDDDILIAPEALLDSINVLDHGENEEIDKKVYESYATGKITEHRFDTLCAEYEREQADLEAMIAAEQIGRASCRERV